MILVCLFQLRTFCDSGRAYLKPRGHSQDFPKHMHDSLWCGIAWLSQIPYRKEAPFSVVEGQCSWILGDRWIQGCKAGHKSWSTFRAPRGVCASEWLCVSPRLAVGQSNARWATFLFTVWVPYLCKSIAEFIIKVPSASQSMSATSESYWYEYLFANKKKAKNLKIPTLWYTS